MSKPSLSASAFRHVVRDVLGDRVGKVRIGLDAVEKLGIAIAIERARLVSDTRR
jgi:hypothetical protein